MHGVLLVSASLSALVAATAAAQGGEQVYFTIKLENAHVADIGDSPGQQIAVRSFEWGGTRGTTPYKLDRTFVKSWSTSGDADAPPRTGSANELSIDDTAGKERTARKDMTLKGQTIKQNVQPYGGFTGGVRVASGDVDGSGVGANETLTVGGARTEARSMETMKKGWRDAASQPLQNGSVWVRVSSPWTACRVGTRYPSLELAGGGKTYVMRDVTVSSCGAPVSPDEVAFSYKTIKFNY